MAWLKGPRSTGDYVSINDNVVFNKNVIMKYSSPWSESFFVDGDNGNDDNSGKTPDGAKKTVGSAISAASAGDTIYVMAKTMATGATDPASYEENIIIPAAKDRLSIIGVNTGRTQGGLPQFKDGTGTTTAIVIIRAPSSYIANIGINGAGNTGGGILLDDDGSTKTAFGTTIENCHFKNSKSSGNASTGGAIMWAATGGAWQVRIIGNLFYNCRAGIVLKGTTSSVPQDVVIEGNDFTSSVNTNVDADLYLAGGSGMSGLLIKNNNFGTVDVPAYASSPAAARYMDLTGCKGAVVGNTFACLGEGGSEKTFGATGTGAKIPTTVRFSRNYGESATQDTSGELYRT